MTDSPVITSLDDKGVFTFILNNPQGHNSFDYTIIHQIADAIAEAADNPKVRVIIYTGVGDWFNTGGSVPPGTPEDKLADYRAGVAKMRAAFDRIKVPMISAVNGQCSAGGMDVLANSDLAVAVKTAKFGFTEIKHGSFPMMVMVDNMDIIPKKKALYAFYSGELFSAEEALSYGLLNCIVDTQEEMMAKAHEFADLITCRTAHQINTGRQTYYAMKPMTREERNSYGAKVLKEMVSIQAQRDKD